MGVRTWKVAAVLAGCVLLADQAAQGHWVTIPAFKTRTTDVFDEDVYVTNGLDTIRTNVDDPDVESVYQGFRSRVAAANNGDYGGVVTWQDAGPWDPPFPDGHPGAYIRQPKFWVQYGAHFDETLKHIRFEFGMPGGISTNSEALLGYSNYTALHGISGGLGIAALTDPTNYNVVTTNPYSVDPTTFRIEFWDQPHENFAPVKEVCFAVVGFGDYNLTVTVDYSGGGQSALSSYIAASEYGDTGFHFLAPEDQTITRVTFDNDSLDRRIIVLDDIGFILVPEPATLCALLGAAVPMLRRRRAKA